MPVLSLTITYLLFLILFYQQVASVEQLGDPWFRLKDSHVLE